jgi:hypothetical protein
VVALIASFVTWLDKRKTDRDQSDVDDIIVEYSILLTKAQGGSVAAGMMKRYVPGFGFLESAPIPVDVVNLLEKVVEIERRGSIASVEQIRSEAPGGLGPGMPSPEWAIKEAISRRLVESRGRVVRLTRKGRILQKAYSHLSHPDQPAFPR